MSTETHRVLIGAAGWKHAAWLNDFYSDDLPEDWQLGFYSNEFPVVYVLASDWLDDSEFSNWIEDISETFRFILEVPAQLLSDKAKFISTLNKVKALDEFCLGFVFQLTQNICDDAALLNTCCEMAKMIAPVCVDMKEVTTISDEVKSIFITHKIIPVWHGELHENEVTEGLRLSGGALAISKVVCENLDMRGLRTILERCLDASNENCVSVLILDGEPPSLEMLRNADTLLNLL